MVSRFHRYFFLCVLLLLNTLALHADVTGSIQGYVHDASGAVLPNAHVVVTDATTGFSREATTDSQGQYVFLALPAGSYKIVASMAGFEQSTINNIDLKVNDKLRLDATLKVGSVQENVSVDADTLQVQTESTQIGVTLESAQILAMPLNGRSYLDLLSLQAGVAPMTAGTLPSDRTVSGLFTNAGNVSVNGQPESANAFLVNGGDVSETKNMGAGLIPNLDSVQEFRLITNSFDAEYGKFTGAVMNTITKSGTNSIHGTVFEFLRNAHLDARNYFDPTRANLHRNQFGYAVGGPFWKNRLFWFTDYQGTRQVKGASTGLIQLPSVTERAGNFGAGAFGDNAVAGAGWAQILSKRLGYTVTNGEPYNTVFPNGVIPTRAIDPVAVNEMKFIPNPNINPATGLYSSSSTKDRVIDTNLGQRVDFVNKMTGTWSFYYHYDDSTALNTIGGQAYLGAPALPGFPTTQPSRNQLFMVSNTKTIGPTAVNVARFTFFRTAVTTAQPDPSTTMSLASLGFTTGPGTLGIVPTGPAGYPESVPPSNFNNYSFGNNWLNLFQVDNNFMVGDTFSKTFGKHSLSFGGEYRYYQLNVRNICGPHGYFVFNGTETSIDYADFLLGAPAQYVQCSEQYLDNRAGYGGAFGQDSFKVLPNLTLNYGLRYEVASPWWDTIGQLTTIVPGVQSKVFPTAPLGYLVPGDPGVPRTISPTRWNNFAPRVGLAYSPSASSNVFLHALFGGPGESSIRGAYGIYYLGAADIGNFGIIGDAPWGLYWQSIAPPTFNQPFMTRATQASQGQRFPFTFPPPGGTHPGFNFNQFLPLFSPGYDTNNKLTYAEHYNFTIQRQISKSTVLSVGYVGTQSHRIQLTNNLIIGNGQLCLQLASQGCGPGGETSVYQGANGQPIYGTMQGKLDNQALGPQFGGVVVYGQANLDSNIGKSNFNSLQVTLERRAADLTFLLAYTYGKSYDNVSTTLNVLNPSSSYVISPFDVTNNFVASYSWQIPFDRAFGANRLTKGWSLNGISRFAGGFPVSLSQSGDIAMTGIGIDFPNIAGPVRTQNPRNPNNQFFNTSAFSTELPGIIGNSGARLFHGPGTINTDLGASKDTHITERTSIILRAEFFNLFNHTNFTGVVGNFASSQFGQVTNTQAARIGQVSGKFIF